MLVTVVWLVAYLIAGFLYVRRDTKQPAWNRPAYARSSTGRWAVRLLWLPVTLRMILLMLRMGSGLSRYLRNEALPSYVTFIVLGFVGGMVATD